jgi:hypothetical protein
MQRTDMTLMGVEVWTDENVHPLHPIMISSQMVIDAQDELNRLISGQVEIPQVFPPVEIRAPHDARCCPKCGYKLQSGDWPWCGGRRGHEPVQQGVGHPIVMERRKD